MKDDEWIGRSRIGGKESRIDGTIWQIVTASGAGVKGNHKSFQAALAAYRKLPAVERKPVVEERGAYNPRLQYADEAPPAGALFVNVYCRPLDRGGTGGFRQAKRVDLTEFGGRGWGNGHPGDFSEPQRECLWLTEKEWKALLPERPRKGATVPVASAVQKRMFLFYVFNWHSNSGGGYWTPEHLRDSALSLMVENVSAKTVRLRLHGHALFKIESKPGNRTFIPPTRETGQKLPEILVQSYDVKVEGAVEYDPVAKLITRFDAVALGDYRGPWVLSYKEKPVPVGIAFQLDTRKLAPEHRHAPFALSAVRERYWAPHKWRP